MTINKFGKTVLSNINHNYSSVNKKIKLFENEINILHSEQSNLQTSFLDLEKDVKNNIDVLQNLEKDLTLKINDNKTILLSIDKKLLDFETKISLSIEKIKNLGSKCNNLKNKLDTLSPLIEIIPNVDILKELITQKIQERLDRIVK